jgi:hypothetical protein
MPNLNLGNFSYKSFSFSEQFFAHLASSLPKVLKDLKSGVLSEKFNRMDKNVNFYTVFITVAKVARKLT